MTARCACSSWGGASGGARSATSCSFNGVVRAACPLGQTAIGYRTAATGEVVLDPPESAPLSLAADDQIVIIAGRG